MADVLAAADKYQIKNVFSWFEKEVTIEVLNNNPPTMKEPLLCLGLASRYGLRTIARMALRQLVKCPLREITRDVDIGEALLKRLFTLRAARIQWLTDAIVALGDSYADQPHCKRHSMPFITWAGPALRAIVLEPSWRVIFTTTRVYHPRCTCRGPSISVEWKERALAIENELPALGEGRFLDGIAETDGPNLQGSVCSMYLYRAKRSVNDQVMHNIKFLKLRLAHLGARLACGE